MTQSYRKTITMAILLLGCALLISMSLGRYTLDWDAIFNPRSPRHARAILILFNIRLPRILTGVVVGIALGTAGATLQTLFRNPMASPATLGASSAAAFGALLAIFLGLSYGWVIVLAFVFGVVSIAIAFVFLRHFAVEPVLGLLLTGMVIAALFQGLISLLKLLADPLETLPEMTYWLFGSLSAAQYRELVVVALITGGAWLVLYLLSFKINILAMGRQEAQTMGVNVHVLLAIAVLSATLLTAASVAISGMIHWLGLIIPHISRRLVGHDLKRLIVMSSLLGSSFLVAVDTLSRTLHTAEIPVGILISLIGAPLFLCILYQRRSHFYD